MSTLPRLISRYSNRVEFVFRDLAGVTRYRISGHKTLNGAYAGTVNMFTVNAGTSFRSPTITANGWGLIDECSRGLTRVMFSPDDYSGLSANLPTDNFALYLRVEDEVGGVWQPPSPIYVLPPESFFTTKSQTVTLAGNAPGITAIAGEPPPSTSLFVALPKTASVVEANNLNAGGGANLMVCFNEGMGMAPIIPSSESTTFDDAVRMIILASSSGVVTPFALFCSMDKF